MIYGIVSSLCEATLPILVKNANGRQSMVDTVIDTGFNGFLTLPSSVISDLDLPWQMSEVVTLGDGSKAVFDLFSATVIWDGHTAELTLLSRKLSR